MDCSPPGFSVHVDFPAKNIGVGCHALLQGIFPTQGLNLNLLCLVRWQEGFFTTDTTWEAQKRGHYGAAFFTDGNKPHMNHDLLFSHQCGRNIFLWLQSENL